MKQLVDAGSQLVVSTHSPILMAYPGARIVLLDRKGLREVRNEETEHFVVTRAFLMNPEKMLREVLSGADDEADASDGGEEE